MKGEGRGRRRRAADSRPYGGTGTSSVSRTADSCPPCGTRKSVRAYADPPDFRPLRKNRTAFSCRRQRRRGFPRARGENEGTGDSFS